MQIVYLHLLIKHLHLLHFLNCHWLLYVCMYVCMPIFLGELPVDMPGELLNDTWKTSTKLEIKTTTLWFWRADRDGVVGRGKFTYLGYWVIRQKQKQKLLKTPRHMFWNVWFPKTTYVNSLTVDSCFVFCSHTEQCIPIWIVRPHFQNNERVWRWIPLKTKQTQPPAPRSKQSILLVSVVYFRWMNNGHTRKYSSSKHCDVYGQFKCRGSGTTKNKRGRQS